MRHAIFVVLGGNRAAPVTRKSDEWFGKNYPDKNQKAIQSCFKQPSWTEPQTLQDLTTRSDSYVRSNPQ